MTRLNPVLEIDGKKVVMSTTEHAGVAEKDLGEKVGSLAHERLQIIAALGFVFTGSERQKRAGSPAPRIMLSPEGRAAWRRNGGGGGSDGKCGPFAH